MPAVTQALAFTGLLVALPEALEHRLGVAHLRRAEQGYFMAVQVHPAAAVQAEEQVTVQARLHLEILGLHKAVAAAADRLQTPRLEQPAVAADQRQLLAQVRAAGHPRRQVERLALTQVAMAEMEQMRLKPSAQEAAQAAAAMQQALPPGLAGTEDGLLAAVAAEPRQIMAMHLARVATVQTARLS